MPEETDWLAYARDVLIQRQGAMDVAAITLRADSTRDEWLRGHLVKLGADELVRQVMATTREKIEPIIAKRIYTTLTVHDGVCAINESKANELAKAVVWELHNAKLLRPDFTLEKFAERICDAIAHGHPWRDSTGEVKSPEQWATLIYSGLELRPSCFP